MFQGVYVCICFMYEYAYSRHAYAYACLETKIYGSYYFICFD